MKKNVKNEFWEFKIINYNKIDSYIIYKHDEEEIKQWNVSFWHKRQCQKLILETWFYFNTNIKTILWNFDNLIKKEINKKIFYFWNRNIWILEIIENIKKWSENNFEIEIFNKVMKWFWNRKFFDAIYSIQDNRANWMYKMIEYF